MDRYAEERKEDLPGAETGKRPIWHALELAEVEPLLKTGEKGLSQEEAGRRLERYGPNRLEEVPPPSALAVLLRQFKSPSSTYS